MMNKHPMLNSPEKVGLGKVQTYTLLKENDVNTLDFTTSFDTARGWQRDEFKVVGRDRDHGMGGAGITVYQPKKRLGNHKFYTKYFKKEREFRVHIFLDKVIFLQEKLRRNDSPNADKYIRSHGRGWCFAFKHLVKKPVPHEVVDSAIHAVKCLGLDFGGVDIGWNEEKGGAVFEVNTAPGIENTSLAAYVKTIQQL